MSELRDQEQFENNRTRMENIALETLRDVFHRMPFGQEIMLSNGQKGTIKPFYEPTVRYRDVDDHLEGQASAGIDVRFHNDLGDQTGHLEFTIYMSGWGHST